MSKETSELDLEKIVDIHPSYRWQVYHRLQELQIPCQYTTGQHLKVKLNTVESAIQLWSVVYQIRSARQELLDWLNLCAKTQA